MLYICTPTSSSCSTGYVVFKGMKSLYQKDACVSMFINMLAIVWHQPKCPSADWIKKIWYMYPVGYHSVFIMDEAQKISC